MNFQGLEELRTLYILSYNALYPLTPDIICLPFPHLIP